MTYIYDTRMMPYGTCPGKYVISVYHCGAGINTPARSNIDGAFVNCTYFGRMYDDVGGGGGVVVMFGKVICQILLAGAPIYVELPLAQAIAKPIVPHINRFGSFLLN